MKYIGKLIELGCFSRKDVVELIGSEKAAHSILNDYVKNGYIDRIRRDLYTAISLETKQPVANRFLIATHIAGDAYISHHSAFEYYGYANQVFHEVFVSTNSRFTDFSFEGITFTGVSPKIDSGVITSNTGIRATDLERTVIDSIYSFKKIGGLEELLRCLLLVPGLRADKLVTYLDEYGQANLYQKSGFLLREFAEQLGLTKPFFDYCKSKIAKSKIYLYSEKDALSKHFVLHEDWMIFAPKNIKSILSKGVDLSD
ncbi:MAG: type IV toxin-antitoxin system AbiEi family antitoxin [Candidatus Riflebacteria bacterium]|jgi:predicted transcriptional regulator of viral defense system|nr:type IV toxin-antitoxin system AbiEi family antitoxin [Candidatus Riflebacteria bacterium]